MVNGVSDPVLSTYSGVYGDVVKVTGDGVTAGGSIELYWDSIQPWDGESGLLNTSTAEADGSWEIWFTVPEAVNGSHYIWVKDGMTGETVNGGPFSVKPLLDPEPNIGLPGDDITINGYGFIDEDTISLLFSNNSDYSENLSLTPSSPETDIVGSWIVEFEVPNVDYGYYNISAVDSSGVEAYYSFNVGAVMALSKSEGPSGTVTTIRGRGFSSSSVFTVDLGATTCVIIDEDSTSPDGSIETQIVIPSMPLIDGKSTEYELTLEDSEGIVATSNFVVNGIAEIEASPKYGPQGAVITVEGWNFTKIAGTEVEVSLDGIGVTAFETDSSGYFTGSYRIPAVSSGDHALIANIVDHQIEAATTIRVGLIIVILSPESTVSGSEVTVTGSGFTSLGDLSVYLGDDLWVSMEADPDGTFAFSENVPTMDAGVYLVKVVDEDTEIEVETELEVTEKTKVTLTPAQAPQGYNVTMEGWYFAENPGDSSLEFVLFNSTHEWALPVEYGGIPVELEADADWGDGYFKGFFEIYDDFSVGTYTLNVTDAEGMWAQTSLEVIPPILDIHPRKQVFLTGDTVVFDINCSFILDGSYVEIYEPNGNLRWVTDVFESYEWIETNSTFSYPYYAQTAQGNPMK